MNEWKQLGSWPYVHMPFRKVEHRNFCTAFPSFKYHIEQGLGVKSEATIPVQFANDVANPPETVKGTSTGVG